MSFEPNDTPADVLVVIALFLSVPLTVLLIGCANSANLQLGRACARQAELATRIALGASAVQLVRVLTLEALWLSSAAAAVGWFGAQILLNWVLPYLPWEVGLDIRVGAFVLVLVTGATVVSGVLPGWLMVRRTSVSLMNESGRGSVATHRRVRTALVVTQVALSLTLLVMSGLFTRSIRAIVREVPPTYRSTVIVDLDLRQAGGSAGHTSASYDALVGRIATDPREHSAAVATTTVLRYSAGDATDSLER